MSAFSSLLNAFFDLCYYFIHVFIHLPATFENQWNQVILDASFVYALPLPAFFRQIFQLEIYECIFLNID